MKKPLAALFTLVVIGMQTTDAQTTAKRDPALPKLQNETSSESGDRSSTLISPADINQFLTTGHKIEAVNSLVKVSQHKSCITSTNAVEFAGLYEQIANDQSIDLSEAKRAELLGAAEDCLGIAWQNPKTDETPQAAAAFIGPAVMAKLRHHVVSVGNNGALAQDGRMVSSEAQVSEIFAEADKVQTDWLTNGKTKFRDILIYAHGGLTPESHGLAEARRHIQKWEDSYIYPISIVWRTGLGETLKFIKADKAKEQDAANGLMIDLKKATFLLSPKLVEKAGRKWILPIWSEMKKNALSISEPGDSAGNTPSLKAGQLLVQEVKKYADKHPHEVRVHLVGFSAGSIVAAGLIQELRRQRITADNLFLLAPAISVNKFDELVVPRLSDGTVGRLTMFSLDNKLESADLTGIKGVAYRGSLLILVSHALEDQSKVIPILGVTKDLGYADLEGNHEITYPNTNSKVSLVISPFTNDNPDCSAHHHGGFDEDQNTVDAIIRMVHGQVNKQSSN